MNLKGITKVAFIFLSTISVTSWAEASQSVGCSTFLAAQDPLVLAVSGYDLRGTILARRRFKGDLDFSVPEFKPILETMLSQIDQLEDRLDTVPRRTFRVISRNLTIPLKISIFRRSVQKMLATGVIPYWETIDLVTRFNRISQSTNLVEGNLNWRSLVEHYVDQEMAELKKMARLYPIVVVPAVNGLSEKSINRFWSRGVLPIGSTMKVEEVDYTIYGPAGFGRHDAQHAKGLVYALLRAVSSAQVPDYDMVTDLEYAKMDKLLSLSSQIMSVFFSRVDEHPFEPFQDAIEHTYFKADHEGRGFVSYLSRPIDLHRDIVLSFDSNEDRVQLSRAKDWIIEEWNASRLIVLGQ